MTAPARFYKGVVSHRRFGKPAHSLRYRIAYLLIDLDRLEEAGRLSRFLRIGRGPFLSFDPRDHGEGKTDDLAGWVRAYLRSKGVEAEASSIGLMTLPRILGYVFNPVSVYFIRDGNNSLEYILYEVGNTFGERHFYLCPVVPEAGTVRQSCDKAFYVSPFFNTRGQYEFRITEPAETFRLSIRYSEGGMERLSAGLAGNAAPLNTRSSLGLLLSLPFMTLGVTFAIHWEALKLWLKGARYHRHEKKADTPSFSLGHSAGAPGQEGRAA